MQKRGGPEVCPTVTAVAAVADPPRVLVAEPQMPELGMENRHETEHASAGRLTVAVSPVPETTFVPTIAAQVISPGETGDTRRNTSASSGHWKEGSDDVQVTLVVMALVPSNNPSRSKVTVSQVAVAQTPVAPAGVKPHDPTRLLEQQFAMVAGLQAPRAGGGVRMKKPATARNASPEKARQPTAKAASIRRRQYHARRIDTE
jgi:hypothetical protein